MLCIIQTSNRRQWNAVWVGAKRPAQTQHSREGNSNLEVTCSRRFSGMSNKRPLAILGLNVAPNWHASQSFTASKCITKNFSMGLPTWPAWFQPSPHGAARYRMPCLHSTWKQENMGSKSKKGFYIGTFIEHYRYFKAYCSDTRAV